jgi:hypothetical protein
LVPSTRTRTRTIIIIIIIIIITSQKMWFQLPSQTAMLLVGYFSIQGATTPTKGRRTPAVIGRTAGVRLP